MPRNKEFCPFENEFFDSKDFEVVDGHRLHRTEPLHGTDGIRVEIRDGKVFPLGGGVIESLGQRMLDPDERS